MPARDELLQLVQDFASRLEILIREQLIRRLTATLDAPSSRNRGRPRKQDIADKRRPVVLSPAAKRTRRLQGQYLGLLRGLKPADRATVKRIAREKGVAAAVKGGTRLRGRTS